MPDRGRRERACAPTDVLIAVTTWLSVGGAITPAAGVAWASGLPQGVPPAEQQVFQSVIRLFDRFPIVALGETHWIQNERDFEIALVQAPGFAGTVNDIVMECGNTLYQGVLDRYVRGEDVPYAEVQQVWRNTTQTGRCDSPDRAGLIEAVRTINRRLPPERRLRILAGDPPVDWSKVRSAADLAPFMERDAHFAAVVEREVLAKHRKALLQIGDGHVLRRSISWANPPQAPAADNPTVTTLIERAYPHSVYVIMPHSGFGAQNATLETRLNTWSHPALRELAQVWPGDLDAGVVFTGQILRVGQDPRKPENPYPGSRLTDLADGYLYFGPVGSLVRVPEVAYPAADSGYVRELARRRSFETAPLPLPRP